MENDKTLISKLTNQPPADYEVLRFKFASSKFTHYDEPSGYVLSITKKDGIVRITGLIKASAAAVENELIVSLPYGWAPHPDVYPYRIFVFGPAASAPIATIANSIATVTSAAPTLTTTPSARRSLSVRTAWPTSEAWRHIDVSYIAEG